jgi:tetratricopeptide (TPR) repeat protein
MRDNSDYLVEYLAGGLSPEEMKEFEARLATDEDLNKEYQLLSKGMDYLKTRIMLDEIEKDPNLPELEKEFEAYYSEKEAAAPKPKFRKTLWRTLQAAAFIASLLVIRSLLFAVTTAKLYNRYYDPLPGEALSEQVILDSTNASVQAGIDSYLEKDYVGAVNHLIALPEGLFFLGLSQLGLEQFDKARESLQAFQDTYPDDPEANWYLGLTYLKLDELDEALNSLNKLSSMDNPYRDRAEELIGKIERIKAARVFDN